MHDDDSRKMTPEEFNEAVQVELGYDVTYEDHGDTPVAWLHKVCHKLGCDPRFQEHFLSQEAMYAEPTVLAKQYDVIVSLDCGHGPFLKPPVKPLPPPTL
jgi:hypothetical protein